MVKDRFKDDSQCILSAATRYLTSCIAAVCWSNPPLRSKSVARFRSCQRLVRCRALLPGLLFLHGP
jgi:hypothetical protein